jgi:hypothetical protein
MAARIKPVRKAGKAGKPDPAPRPEVKTVGRTEDARVLQVRWDEERITQFGYPERFFMCGTCAAGVWRWEERSCWESAYFPVAPHLWDHCHQKASELLRESMNRSITIDRDELGLGDAKDNEAVLDRARYLIAMEQLDEARHLLTHLERHLVTSPDPKNNVLLPAARRARDEAERAAQVKMRAVSGAAAVPGVKPSGGGWSVHRLKSDLLDASVLLSATSYAVGFANSELHIIAPALLATPFAANAVAASLLGIALYVVKSRSG